MDFYLSNVGLITELLGVDIIITIVTEDISCVSVSDGKNEVIL